MRILRRVCCTSAAGLTFLGLIGVLSGGTARAEEQSYAPHPDSDRLEEVVVTARKREESLQNTPIAISAYTAADIEARQLTNLSQISASTPSLVIAPAPQVGNP